MGQGASTQVSPPSGHPDTEQVSPFKCIHGFPLSVACGYCDEEAQRTRDATMAVETELVAGRERITQLEASLREMVDIYWGDGDGIHPPPMCIQRAMSILGETK